MSTRKRYALVQQQNGNVQNTCVWDGLTPWSNLDEGIFYLECPENVSPGWHYVNGEWVPPEPTEVPPEPTPTQEE